MNEETGELDVRDFDLVRGVFDERIRTIKEGTGSEEVRLFLTGDRTSQRIIERSARREGKVADPLQANFREKLALGKPYKGTRKGEKPFHFNNLTAYILSHKNTHIANGCEADDLMGIEHTRFPETTIICTRDKDLRMVPGWHYGWECGKQPEIGPIHYDAVGKIELVRTTSGSKIKGGGMSFFCAQLLTGDVVDNIGGAKGLGPIKAYALLQDCKSERDYFNTVVLAYQKLYGDRWLQLLKEQCALLWIIRERNEDGSLKHFNIEEWL